MREKRIARVRELMQDERVDALLVTAPKNIRYLADFTGTAGMILLTEEEDYFITDFRYNEQARSQAVDYQIVIHKGDPYAEVDRLLADHGCESLGYEGDHMTITQYIQIEERLDCELVHTSGLVETAREVKDNEELELLREACRITDRCFDHLLEYIKPGMTERQVSNEILRFCLEQGAEEMGYESIVASGYRSSMPHGVASDKVIEEGDMLTLDFGAVYKGYTADMTRTIAIGDVDPQLVEIYQIVHEAQRRVTEAIRDGVTAVSELDVIARDYIGEMGYGENFGHGLGHGIGLNVHENPFITRKSDVQLVPGNTVTNEPGIYIEGLGGVRIEDDIFIHEDGIEILTHSPRELIVLK